MNEEARKHLAAIDVARGAIKRSMNEIREHQRALVREVVIAFNEASINGARIESRDVVLGFRQCEKSPVDVCVYVSLTHDVMSIPGQHEMRARRTEKGSYLAEDELETMSAATRTDACLFCGVPGPMDGER